MEIKLLSGALGAEIKGIDLTDVSNENFKKVNDLLLEHKVIFFREQPITKDQQVALAEKFGPLETHAYVKGLENYPLFLISLFRILTLFFYLSQYIKITFQ